MHEDMIRNIVKRMPSHGSHREPFNYNDHLLDALHYSGLARPKRNCYDTVEITPCERRYRIMESLVNKESENDNNQENEVKECQFCGEFRTDYEDPDCYGGWTSEDFCNAGHDLEDTDPNSCKDYWDNF